MGLQALIFRGGWTLGWKIAHYLLTLFHLFYLFIYLFAEHTLLLILENRNSLKMSVVTIYIYS